LISFNLVVQRKAVHDPNIPYGNGRESLPVQDIALAIITFIALGAAAALVVRWLPAAPELPRSVLQSSLARQAASTYVAPARLSAEQQWDQVTGIVRDSIRRVDTMNAMQLAASQQLDSATYALQQLASELRGVVDPGRLGSVTGSSVVSAFPPPRRRPADRRDTPLAA